MSYVINYEGGRFILPKLNITTTFHSRNPYIPTSTELDIVRAQATQIAVETSNAYYKSCVTDGNLIGYGRNVDGSVGYPIYRTTPPYKIDDRNELYLNIFTVNPQGGRNPYAYGVKDTLDNRIYLDGLGYSTFNQMDQFFPEIFMFADSVGNPYIVFITKSTKYDYGYALSPSKIAPDGVTTKYVYDALFPLGDIDTSDPYWGGDYSNTGGGQGTFDGSSEPIDFPPMPTLSAADTKFITLYNPTLSQLRDLSSYMWSDLFSLDTLKKIFANPMDCILGLSIVPVNVPDGGVRALTVGNIPTDISMTVAGSQYVDVDCGTLDVKEYWGAYLDYSPYTKFELYLPYIGVRPISADDVMNKTIAIKYRVDILTGACCAFVKCGNSVLYTYVGQCSTSIPITSNDFTSVITGALGIAGAIGATVASGGMTAPLSAAKAASTGAAIASTAANVASAKPHIEKSGSMSGTGGMLGIQTPYLIVTRPRQCLPQKQNTYTGYPSYITAKLSDLSGYTVVSDIHLEGIPATAEEVSEIDRLLKEGVII